MLKRRLPNALYIDLLNPERYRSLLARPERLTELMAASPTVDTIVIDEIQRVPELLNVVHAALELPGQQRFIMTGSSARKLRRSGTNLLGGRAANRSLHPFMACELSNFDLDHAMRWGMVPLILDSPDPDVTLSSYANLYLEQEVQAEGLSILIRRYVMPVWKVSLPSICVPGLITPKAGMSWPIGTRGAAVKLISSCMENSVFMLLK